MASYPVLDEASTGSEATQSYMGRTGARTDTENTLGHLQWTFHRLARVILQVEKSLIHSTQMTLEDLLSGLGKGGWEGCWVQENGLIHSSTTLKMSWGLRCKT